MGVSRQILNTIAKRIIKSPLVKDATSAIENVTEKTLAKVTNMQSVASKNYNTIVKQVNGTTIMQQLNAASLQPASPLPKHLVNWWQWYQQLTGLDTVELAKEHVICIQDKLFKCQNERRSLTCQVAIINDKLKEIYGELVQTRRDDPKYVQLTIMENKKLQDQSRITKQLSLLENEEGDYFTQLQTAIKEYHDTQTMNAQRYKYLSILASSLLAIVSLTGSMIYNNRRIADVRNVISEGQRKNEIVLKNYFDTLECNSNKKFSEIITRLNEQGVVVIRNVDTSISSDLHNEKNEKDSLHVSTNERIKRVVSLCANVFSVLYILYAVFHN